MRLLAGLLALTVGFGLIVGLSIYFGLKSDQSVRTPNSFSITEKVER